MALAGAPARAPRHALLVGSNPAVTRVLRTYLQREGVLCREATPESVFRAAARLASSGEVEGLYADPVAVALVVASVGIDVARLREALSSLPTSAAAPVLTIDSLAGDGLRPGTTGAHHLTLAWPFRLRDVMDAISTAVAVQAVEIAPVRSSGLSSALRLAPNADVARTEVAGGVARP